MDFLSKVKASFSETTNSTDLIDTYWPIIQNAIMEKSKDMIKEGLKDENIETVLNLTYETLPSPVRLILPKDKFIEYSISKKNDLLDMDSENIDNIVKTEEKQINYEKLLVDILAISIVADNKIEAHEISFIKEIINNDPFIYKKDIIINNVIDKVSFYISENYLENNKLIKKEIFNISIHLLDFNNNEQKQRLSDIINAFSEMSNHDTINILLNLKQNSGL